MANRAPGWGPDTDFFSDQNPVSDPQYLPLLKAGATAGMTQRAGPVGNRQLFPDPPRSQLGMGNRSRMKAGVAFSGSRFLTPTS
jgi:hypothetical protein